MIFLRFFGYVILFVFIFGIGFFLGSLGALAAVGAFDGR